MNKNKILAAALCGTMLVSVTGAPAAAEDAAGYKPGKEKVLTDISSVVKDYAQEHMSKMASLVKAAVQVAKAEEEARKAAEAAAEETKAKQEAAAAEKKEKEKQPDVKANPVSSTPENYKPYYETLYSAKTPAADTTAESETDTAAPAVVEPVYAEPVYAEPVYTAPVYTAPVYYTEPVYTEPVYTEPVYTEPVYEEPVYEEPVIEETYAEAPVTESLETAAYDDSAYLDASYTEDYYTDGAYTDETYTENAGSGEVRATASDSDLDLLASIIYCEAGGESYEGQVAVGAVVLNRMESELYPDDMTDVIYQSGQFTPAMTGWLDEVRASGVPDYCYDAAQAALNGENPVGDCLYFHAGGGDGLTIGNQTFY